MNRFPFPAVRRLLPVLLLTAYSALAGTPAPPDELRQDALSGLQAFRQRHPAAAAAADAAAGQTPENTPDDLRWAAETLRFARAVLDAAPPDTGDPEIRRAALELIDFPLRIEDRDPQSPDGFGRAWRETVRRVYGPAFDRMLDEIAAARVERGARIWKAYNMGFLVKTARHTYAFDLRSGDPVTRRYTPEQLRRLAGMLDALFLSHNHLDHIGADLAEAMLDAGKPVIRPTDQTLESLGRRPGLRTVYGSPEPFSAGGLTCRAFPGEQKIPGHFTPCNVYAVTADGVTVIHNGDNQSAAPYELLARSGLSIQVAIANSWSGFAPFLAAARPEKAVIGHEHELKHRVPGRAPFVTVFRRLQKERPAMPVRVVDCGESIHWPAGPQDR